MCQTSLKTIQSLRPTVCALVLGSYVNGYSVIRDLHECGVRDIVLCDSQPCFARLSNKIKLYVSIKPTAKALREAIAELEQRYSHIVIYPTDDLQIEWLHTIYQDIEEFCFIPFNPRNVAQFSRKEEQYKACQRLGVPYPKTIHLCDEESLDEARNMPFPLLLKPSTRLDMQKRVFRSLQLNSPEDFVENRQRILGLLREGISLIASEIVPGDGSAIFAYVGYRSPSGRILSEWIGKKLSQFPDEFGCFASASNEAPEIIRQQGRALLEGMDLHGINEPEFKYDARDGEYKLMEINLRSMMWNRMGNLSGVNVQYAQFLDATGKETPHQDQVRDRVFHFVYFKHEIINLFSRKGYWRVFAHNLFRADKVYFAVFNVADPIPGLYDLRATTRSIVCLMARPFWQCVVKRPLQRIFAAMRSMQS